MKIHTHKKILKIKKLSKRQKGGTTPENVTNNRRMRNSNFYNEFTTPSSTPSDNDDEGNNNNVNVRRGTRRRTRSESEDSFDNIVNRLDFSGVSTPPDYNLIFSDDLSNDGSLESSNSTETLSHIDPFITKKLDSELSKKIKLN
jgi:hypothetical protein